ncbi:ribonuclease E domain-containing protein [Adhaeribacter soli]|uniref:Tetratricopeptide repeat protein n=1 Tax=Adhaeribacter soli TaxID=2607655 RepID=A0A5N1J5W2_9BACT|nr:hypothetical protein [Adhaeribacter soli]KAA9346104.1 hypothetical protein F0P94_03210 [Adhaeribacter soli]
MNKTSFLTLVRQASRISDQDVEELEKLVVNFPYCQTAHLLIAKAAYDKGSMLSNQKLKKAAIYAANRQLLKKLIYTSDATVALQPVQEPEPAETVANTTEKVPALSQVVSAAPVITPEIQNTPEIKANPETKETALPSEPEAPVSPEISEEQEVADTVSEIPELPMETEIAAVFSAVRRDYDPELPVEAPELIKDHHVAPELHTFEALPEEVIIEPERSETELSEAELAEPAPLLAAMPEAVLYEDEVIAGEILEASETTEVAAASEIVNSPVITEPASEIYPATEEAAIAAEFIEAEPASSLEEAEPASNAETVAEPAEKAGEFIAGEFITDNPAEPLQDVADLHEFHLTDAPATFTETSREAAPAFVQTEQPTLNDDLLHETLANFDQYLFKPEKETVEAEETEDVKVVVPEDAIQDIYQKDTIGYWMSSSRLGESLQIKDELTGPQPFDFHPELLWEYSKTHELKKEIKPAPSKLSHQLDIIDQFLKMTPRLKAMANAKIKAEPQEDLSLKSSKINKNLASENFANILVQQGKIKKAIKIYEHLILKIPEKKAYFASQIQKLQNLE